MFQFAYVGIAGAGRALSVTVNSVSVAGTAPNGSNQLSDASSTATAADGAPTYNYSWAYVSGAAAISAFTPSAATTIWRATGSDTVHVAVYRCTVTDSLGAIAVAADVTITITQGTP
jgi:hypothetical protein